MIQLLIGVMDFGEEAGTVQDLLENM
jgi:hypothetical protein